MIKIFLVLPLAMVVSTASMGQSKGSITLSKGQKYTVETTITTTSSSDMQGQKMETNSDVSTTFTIEVLGFKEDHYNLSNTMSAIKINISAMGQNINFDSDKKEDLEGDIGASLKGLIHVPHDVQMDRTGNLISNASDTVKQDSSNTQMNVMLKQIGDPEQTGYGTKMAFLPVNKKTKPGTNWQDSTSEDGVTRLTNYTVKQIDGSIAVILISGTEYRDTKMEMQGMEILTKTVGKFNGEQTIDLNTGVVVQNNSTMDAAGNLSVMGQDIPTSIKATTTTTVKHM